MDREAYRRNLLWRLADAASKCARNRVEGFELLRQASAHLHRLHPDHVVMTAQELEANFRRPLETWLPDEIRGELTGVLLAPSNAPICPLQPSQWCGTSLSTLTSWRLAPSSSAWLRSPTGIRATASQIRPRHQSSGSCSKASGRCTPSSRSKPPR